MIVFRRTGDISVPFSSYYSSNQDSSHDSSHGTRHETKRAIDVWWHDVMAQQRPYVPSVPMNSEDPLFLLYTSGSTGKPKGVMHTHAGYLLQAALTTKYIFDVHSEFGDIFGCTADIGWITGHTYIVYGPLCLGTTTFLYEGIPTYPTPSRFWQMVEAYRLTHFYTAPTAIRSLKKLGDSHVTPYDRSSLRVLGTVGEPISPDAWEWYYHVVGNGKCAIVDTYWQTETGAIMISSLPGATKMRPGSSCFPFFGVQVALFHPITGEIIPSPIESSSSSRIIKRRKMLISEEKSPLACQHREIKASIELTQSTESTTLIESLSSIIDEKLDENKDKKETIQGILCMTSSWPSMARTLWGDHDRFQRTYLASHPGCFFTGDGASRDVDGYYYILGRVDDVINVSGHRLGTAEIESAFAHHSGCAEAAVVGISDELTGQAIFAFVVPKETLLLESEELKAIEWRSHLVSSLRQQVRLMIGPFATPKHILLVPNLPKTRSGKIMRRLLRKVSEGERDSHQLGDISTLSDPIIMSHIIDCVQHYWETKKETDAPINRVIPPVVVLR